MNEAQYPYVGMWVTADGSIRHELLPDGRYDDTRTGRKHLHGRRYRVIRSYIDYTDETGFTANGDFADIDVLHHAGMVLRRVPALRGSQRRRCRRFPTPAQEQAIMDDARYQRGLAQLEAVSGLHGMKVVRSPLPSRRLT